MMRIPLSQGQHSIVDKEDYAAMSNRTWVAAWNPSAKGFYAVSTSGGQTTYMHRAILGVTDPRVKVDHRNHNTLDNRRQNLRACTQSQNCANRRGPQLNGTSGYRGVSWNKREARWTARIGVNGRRINLGYFSTVPAAAAAYRAANKKHHGDFGGHLTGDMPSDILKTRPHPEETMKKRGKKLTLDEAKRLVKFVDENGGQIEAAGTLGVTPATLSRTANRHTAPSPLLRSNLVEKGVLPAQA